MRPYVIPLLTTLLMAAAMAYQAMTPDAVVCAAPAVRLGELPGLTSEPVPVGEAERTVLPSDTGFDKRLYRDAEGRTFGVTVVIGGKTKSSVHRPELCLPAQGFQMTDPRNATVAGVDWRLVTLARNQATSLGFAYTFFNQSGYRTASHLSRIFRDVWDRSVLGRVDRWVMVTVSASTDEARVLEGFLAKLKGVFP